MHLIMPHLHVFFATNYFWVALYIQVQYKDIV